MRQLFCGKFAPVTFSYAFFRIPFAVFLDHHASWTKKNHPNSTVEPVECSFREALERMAPLTAPSSKDLVVEVGGGWTAIFSNGLSGDAFARAPYWSSRLQIDAIALECIPDNKDPVVFGARGKYRAMQIQVFLGGGSADEPRRTLCALHDGNRWVFINQGEPFSFENAAQYSASAVRDRVQSGDIIDFCQHFGLPTTECGFSGAAAMILTNRAGSLRSLSYGQAQAALGITLTKQGSE